MGDSATPRKAAWIKLHAPGSKGSMTQPGKKRRN